MSWLETPTCLPDETCQALVRSTGGGSSEWNAMVECICDGLQSNGYTEAEAFQMAVNMCNVFASSVEGLKDLFKEEAAKHGHTITD